MTCPVKEPTECPSPGQDRLALRISTVVIVVMCVGLVGLAAGWLSVNQILVASLGGGAANVIAFNLSKKATGG